MKRALLFLGVLFPSVVWAAPAEVDHSAPGHTPCLTSRYILARPSDPSRGVHTLPFREVLSPLASSVQPWGKDGLYHLKDPIGLVVALQVDRMASGYMIVGRMNGCSLAIQPTKDDMQAMRSSMQSVADLLKSAPELRDAEFVVQELKWQP